jgi:isoaspartyl peptidase/L-asparaginase-like protein (Ntn-hydrolase superfamily)
MPLSACANLESMYALAIHGGAGALPPRTLSPEREAAFHDGLARALAAAQAILEADGRALDAVEQAVVVLGTIRFSMRAGVPC